MGIGRAVAQPSDSTTVMCSREIHEDLRRAGRAGLAAWIGFIVGGVVKVTIAFTMLAIFLAALFLF